jgi:hypothetical protein
MSQTLELTNPSDTLSLDAGEIVAKDLEKIPTGIGTGRVEVPENDAIIPFVQRQDRVNYFVDGECVFTGYAVGYEGDDRTGRWTLRIDGIGKRLEETRPDYDSLGGSLTYTNIALDEALKDYWPRTPFSANVTDQTVDVVESDTLVQDADSDSEWTAITPLNTTDPIGVSGGELVVEQVAFTTEAEDASGNFTNQEVTSDFSNGDGATIAFSDEDISFTFTPQVDIPASDLGLYLRFYAPTESPRIDMELNGTSWQAVSDGAVISSLGWEDFTEYDAGTGETYISEGGGNLEAGTTYTWQIDGNSATTTDAGFAVDVIAPLDDSYSFTFDNDNGGGGGFLDGPELYPTAVTVELASAGTAFNIGASNLDATLNDTSGGQAIAVSNDGGATYTTFNNTDSVDHSYTDAGREARIKFTLGRYGSRTTATPQQGYLGQAVDSFEHRVDLTDLVVIDELELSRNHFDNLKTLHNYGDFLWRIDHDDNSDLSTLNVESFPRGALVESTPEAFTNPENRTPEVAAETYFNTVYLQGRLRADGTRPTAEVQDQDAFNEDGREISPGVLRDPDIGTDAGAAFRANALLQTALNNNDLRGSITTYPVYEKPGSSYEVDWGNGPVEKTLERINIRESAGSLEATYEFVVKESLHEELTDLRRNSREQGNQI